MARNILLKIRADKQKKKNLPSFPSFLLLLLLFLSLSFFFFCLSLVRGGGSLPPPAPPVGTLLHVDIPLGDHHPDTPVQWNLVTKRSDTTKPSHNKVTLLAPAPHVSLFLYSDIIRSLTQQGNPHGPKDLVITRLHCTLTIVKTFPIYGACLDQSSAGHGLIGI